MTRSVLRLDDRESRVVAFGQVLQLVLIGVLAEGDGVDPKRLPDIQVADLFDDLLGVDREAHGRREASRR